MGNVSVNTLAPFQINYKYDDESRAFQADTKKCNESYPVIENSLQNLCEIDPNTFF